MENQAIIQTQMEKALEAIKEALSNEHLTKAQAWHLNVARNSILSAMGK